MTAEGDKSGIGRITDRDQPTTSIEQAQRLFGSDFFGPEAVQNAFGISLAPAEIPQVPWDRETLRTAQKLGFRFILHTDALSNGDPLTILQMREQQTEEDSRLHIEGDMDRLAEQDFFAGQVPSRGWRFVGKSPLLNTPNVNYFFQTTRLGEYFTNITFGGLPVTQDEQTAMVQLNSSSADRPLAASSAERFSKFGVNRLFRQSPVEAVYDMRIVAANGGGKPTDASSTWTNGLVNGNQLVHVRVGEGGDVVFEPLRPSSQNSAGVVFCR